jgi:hypothetical protein
MMKKNLVSLVFYIILKISIVLLIFLDEDDDLSEGDVSADPIEGRCHSSFFLPFFMIHFSFLLLPRYIKRRKT